MKLIKIIGVLPVFLASCLSNEEIQARKTAAYQQEKAAKCDAFTLSEKQRAQYGFSRELKPICIVIPQFPAKCTFDKEVREEKVTEIRLIYDVKPDGAVANVRSYKSNSKCMVPSVSQSLYAWRFEPPGVEVRDRTAVFLFQ